MDVNVPPRTRVGIIGAGRVGRALGHASRRAGLDIVAACSRTDASRQRFSEEFGTTIPARLADAITGCDIILVAVSDEQLEAVCHELAAALDVDAAPLVVLTSGSTSIEVAAPVAAAGGRVVRIHPLHAITDATRPEEFDGVVAAITASTDTTRDAARELATRLGMAPFALDDADAPTWHAAGALAAGGITTLIAAARDLATSAGMTPDTALRAMADLARGAIDRAVDQTPEVSLTGPVVRGDASTVATHLDALRKLRPDLVAPYRAVAQATAELAHRAGRIDDDQLTQLDDAIDDRSSATTWA